MILHDRLWWKLCRVDRILEGSKGFSCFLLPFLIFIHNSSNKNLFPPAFFSILHEFYRVLLNCGKQKLYCVKYELNEPFYYIEYINTLLGIRGWIFHFFTKL